MKEIAPSGAHIPDISPGSPNGGFRRIVTYTGSHLQRVRLLRAPDYNEQIFFSKMNPSHLRQCSNSSDTTSTGYN